MACVLLDPSNIGSYGFLLRKQKLSHENGDRGAPSSRPCHGTGIKAHVRPAARTAAPL